MSEWVKRGRGAEPWTGGGGQIGRACALLWHVYRVTRLGRANLDRGTRFPDYFRFIVVVILLQLSLSTTTTNPTRITLSLHRPSNPGQQHAL